MKLAICTDVFADLSYTDMLDKVKSLGIDAVEMTAGGLLEPRPVTESADRVWNYVAVGCGKDLQWWKKFFSVCHMMGYDGDVSLEMEDLTMTVDAGIHTSIDALRQTISR